VFTRATAHEYAWKDSAADAVAVISGPASGNTRDEQSREISTRESIGKAGALGPSTGDGIDGGDGGQGALGAVDGGQVAVEAGVNDTSLDALVFDRSTPPFEPAAGPLEDTARGCGGGEGVLECPVVELSKKELREQVRELREL
jgi:hypothetical protein